MLVFFSRSAFSFLTLCALVAAVLLRSTAAATAEIEVIGTGLGRTGTDTLKDALNLLGYRTYHMKEIIHNRLTEHMDIWTRIIESNCEAPGTEELLRKVFRELNATATVGINFPCNEKLINMYPDAKVVHTQRYDAELWHDSIVNSICTQFSSRLLKVAAYVSPFFRKLRKLGLTLFNHILVPRSSRPTTSASADGVGASTTTPDEGGPILEINRELCRTKKPQMIAMYHAHNERMVRIVPKERLLVITNHRDGWEPLVKFLGKPMPPDGVAYPWSNSRKDFATMFKGNVSKDILSFVALVAATGAIGYLLHLTMTKKKKT